MTYFKFFLNNKGFLSFGLLLMFSSSFGQTFFISLFSGEIRTEFNLSHGDFGFIYSSSTFASGLTLIWLGQKIDEIDLRKFSFAVCMGLTFATLAMALNSATVLMYLILYLLRLFGQGLMSHTATTSMARYFVQARGKAVSIATLGLPMGEAILPICAVTMISLVGWRSTWLCATLLVFVVITPTVMFLLRDHHIRHQAWLKKNRYTGKPNDASSGTAYTRKDVLADRKFYVIALSVLAPPFIMTGLFFHQVHIASVKGWSLNWLASAFAVFALTTVISSLASGALIDRYKAAKLMSFHLIPLGISLGFLASFNHLITIIPYMVFAGITSGLSNTLISAIWAELYGTRYIGAIKSVVMALMVFASALSPAIFGWLLDLDVSIETIAVGCIAYVATSTAGLSYVFRHQ